MQDMYAEYIVKRHDGIKTSLLKVLVMVVTAVLVYLAMMLTQNVIFLMPAAVALFGWMGYRAYLMLSIEYEYIVTNGELDIDRVIARRGRKRQINIKTNAYELIAPYDDAHKAAYEQGEFSKTIDARSRPDIDGFFVIANVRNVGRVRVRFEPTPKMLYVLSQYVPRQMAVLYGPPEEYEDDEDELDD